MYFVKNGRDKQHEGRRSPQAGTWRSAPSKISCPTAYGEQISSLKHFYWKEDVGELHTSCDESDVSKRAGWAVWRSQTRTSFLGVVFFSDFTIEAVGGESDWFWLFLYKGPFIDIGAPTGVWQCWWRHHKIITDIIWSPVLPLLWQLVSTIHAIPLIHSLIALIQKHTHIFN